VMRGDPPRAGAPPGGVDGAAQRCCPSGRLQPPAGPSHQAGWPRPGVSRATRPGVVCFEAPSGQGRGGVKSELSAASGPSYTDRPFRVGRMVLTAGRRVPPPQRMLRGPRNVDVQRIVLRAVFEGRPHVGAPASGQDVRRCCSCASDGACGAAGARDARGKTIIRRLGPLGQKPMKARGATIRPTRPRASEPGTPAGRRPSRALRGTGGTLAPLICGDGSSPPCGRESGG
jgi:hypothetical protein